MKIVNLPLLSEDLPVMEGLRAARENWHSGVVTSDGEHFRLHRFDDLLVAIREDPTRTLKLVAGKNVEPIRADEVMSGGLDLINPNSAVIENYLQGRDEFARITSVADNPRSIGQIASLLMVQTEMALYVAVTAKRYKCSAGNEVIDEDKLTIDGRCRIHTNGIYKEVT